MDSERSENEPNSTPKLSLSKLPSKIRESSPVIMETPPLNRLVSIPFQWEEVPGKPRADLVTSDTTTAITMSSHNKNSVARCLELPPRLLNATAKFNNASSPTTVLDGPYDSPFLCQTQSFSSLSKGSFRSLIEEDLVRGENSCEKGENMICKETHQRLKFTSWRWGSFNEIRGVPDDHSPSFSTCTSFSSKIHHKSAAKLSRIKRRSSFLKFSHAGSNLLSGVYGSLKQVVSWRRSQE